MVKIKTSFSFCLELQQNREANKIISKVLRVAKETIRTHVRKIT